MVLNMNNLKFVIGPVPKVRITLLIGGANDYYRIYNDLQYNIKMASLLAVHLFL